MVCVLLASLSQGAPFDSWWEVEGNPGEFFKPRAFMLFVGALKVNDSESMKEILNEHADLAKLVFLEKRPVEVQDVYGPGGEEIVAQATSGGRQSPWGQQARLKLKLFGNF